MKFPILLLFSGLSLCVHAQNAKPSQSGNDSLCKRYLREGDVLMEKKNYLAAKKSYEKVCSIDPVKCPNGKIEEAVRLEKADGGHCGDVDEQYRRILVKAGGYYDAKDYAKALEYYKRAASLKPSDTFVQERIKTINGLLDAK